MTVLSNENAKVRLEEFRILLKYMPFLQKNGFSDCGRGQIMGQMSLLQEFLSETQTSEEILNLRYKDSIMPSVPLACKPITPKSQNPPTAGDIQRGSTRKCFY